MVEHYTQRAGIDTYVLYGEESSYAVAPTSYDKIFGIMQRFNASPRRNLIRVRGMKGKLPASNTEPTARDVQHILKGRFEGTASVEFQPITFDFLKYVMGSVSGSGTTVEPYQYPQAEATSDADKKKYLKLPSISLISNYRFGGSGDSADKAWKYLGGMINSFRLGCRLNEVASVTLDVPYGDMKPTTSLATPVALPDIEPYYFVGASIEVPSGNAITNPIQDFELTITNNVEIRYGQGSDTGKTGIIKERDISFTMTIDAENSTFMDYFTGGSDSLAEPTEIAEIVVKMNGDIYHSLIIHLLQCKIDEPTRDMSYPEVITEGLTVYPKVVYFEEIQSA